MNNSFTTSEKVKLYQMLLLYDHIANSFLNLLFHTFKLMFKKHALVREHGIPNTYFYLTNEDDALGKFDSFKIHLYASDSDTYCFEININDIVLNDKTQSLTFESSSPETAMEFINVIAKTTLDVYLESNTSSTKNNSPMFNHVEADVGFMKKIKDIKEDGHMFKYLITFDDNTRHGILSPNELLPQVKVGDFAHLDESNNFNFISKNSIQ